MSTARVQPGRVLLSRRGGRSYGWSRIDPARSGISTTSTSTRRFLILSSPVGRIVVERIEAVLYNLSGTVWGHSRGAHLKSWLPRVSNLPHSTFRRNMTIVLRIPPAATPTPTRRHPRAYPHLPAPTPVIPVLITPSFSRKRESRVAGGSGGRLPSPHIAAAPANAGDLPSATTAKTPNPLSSSYE